MPSLNPVTGNLGTIRAAHLLRRVTFGPTAKEITQFAAITAAEAVQQLFTLTDDPPPPIDPATGQTWLNPRANPDVNSERETLDDYFMAWHIERMRTTDNPLRERIAYFYHTHMPTRRSIIRSSEAIYYQNALYRHYAFGNFKALFKRMCLDNAMLVYLDGATNDYGSPNENFAREMFELYSIGKGPQIAEDHYTNYTEHDIKEAARVLSGFVNDTGFTNLDEETGLPTGILVGETLASRHDPEQKVFSDVFQNTVIEPSETQNGLATKVAVYGEIDAMMDMIFNQPETARFITRKLYRYFVYHEITEEVEYEIIHPLAEIFRNNDFDLQPVLEVLFQSQHFYDLDNSITADNNIGALIKSPLELIVGTLRFFEVSLPDELTDTGNLYDGIYRQGLLPQVFKQGLSFYEPYEVAGYSAYHQMPGYNRNWITPHNLASRYDFSNQITNPEAPLGFTIDVLAWVGDTAHVSNPADAEEIVTALTTFFLAVQIDEDRFDYYLTRVFLDTLSPLDWQHEWENYQSSGNDVSVRGKLETLLLAIMQSPEFQLY